MMSYTEDGYVYVPDARVEVRDEYTYRALRGYGYVLAAYSRGVCIGYVLAEDLGYPTAAAWLLGRA